VKNVTSGANENVREYRNPRIDARLVTVYFSDEPRKNAASGEEFWVCPLFLRINSSNWCCRGTALWSNPIKNANSVLTT